MFHIKHETAISDYVMKDLLCCALEGGSNYWYVIEKVYRTHLDTKDPDVYDAVIDGQGLLIGLLNEDEEVHGKKQWVLNREAVANGLQKVASNRPELFAKIALEDFDADDADVFLQFCLFGELIFG